MATLNKHVGYEYEFVDQVPEDYFCKLCKHVAREPNITTCCGEVFCKACLDVIIQDKKPCPNCESNDIKALGLQVKYQRKILALEVRCTMKDRGCPWTGQLQHLDAHLDVATGDCQYVDVECPKKCVQKVQKRNVDTHLANECPNRDYRCPHCNFANKYHVVSEHFDVCTYYPLACPNRCGATFERDDLQDHMKMCRLEEVQCVFNSAGCQAKFIRENEDEHMDQNTQKHLALMPAATLRICQDFKQKLQEQQEVFEKKQEQKDKEHEQGMQQLGGQLKEFQEQVKQKDEQIKLQQEVFEKKMKQQKEEHEQKQKENDERMQQLGGQLQEQLKEQIKQVEQKLDTQNQEFKERLGGQQKEFQETLQQKQEQIKKVEHTFLEKMKEKDKQIESLQSKIQEITPHVHVHSPPYYSTLSNCRQEKARNGYIHSPPMYTHPGGCKFTLKLFPNGRGCGPGAGAHVTVFVYSLKSDHDAELKFPVKFTITVQLLNQHRDQDHHTRDIQCEMKTTELIGNYIGGDFTFIPHADLEWNRDKQTQYLKDDCLRFRITKIVIH